MTMPQPLFTRADDADTEPHPHHRSGALPLERRALPLDEVRGRIAERMREAEHPHSASVAVDDTLLELFNRVEALRGDRAPYVLLMAGVSHRSGVSTIAEGFARAAALESRSAVLLLDCLPATGPTIVSSLLHTGSVDAALQPVPGSPRLLRASLGDQQRGVPVAAAADLGDIFGLLKGMFAAVILDCPPLRPQSLRMALGRYCDGVVLVVRAERDRRDAVIPVLDLLHRSGAVVVGTILNRQKNHLPAWLDGLLRRHAPASAGAGRAPL